MRGDAIERVNEAINEIAAGRMVVMVDDEERENEGDLVMAAKLVTPDAINFMARHGRGLICLAMSPERIDALQLPLMVDTNPAHRSTAFTVSIEAAEGVTTGISAADRAHTVRVAASAEVKPEEIVSPGHIFPLRAVAGGVLQRAGHTEGSVDLSKLADQGPAGVICEIMNDDGTMARMPDLERFAVEHDLKILSIADLIQYRLQTESLVHKVREVEVSLPPGGQTWKVHVFETAGKAGQNHMLALSLGEIDASPTLVRVQVGSTMGDVFGAPMGLRIVASDAVARIAAEGRGVILYIPSRAGLLSEVDSLVSQATRRPTQDTVLRETGFGSQVLAALGCRKLRLLTNRPSRLVAAGGYDLEVVEQVIFNATHARDDEANHTTH